MIATVDTGGGLHTAVAFSPDGKTLATGSRDSIKVWDLFSEPGWVQLFNGKDLTGWKSPFRNMLATVGVAAGVADPDALGGVGEVVAVAGGGGRGLP